MNHKIFQIIPVNNLLAVIKYKEGFETRPVICLELIEETGFGTIQSLQRERAVIIKNGKLTNTDEVTEFLGLASDKNEAACVFYQSQKKD